MYRVIWQVNPSFLGALDTTELRAFPTTREESTLFSDIRMVGDAESVFVRPPIALRADLLAMPEAFQADPANDLAGYHHAFVEDFASATELRNRLLHEGSVDVVEIQPPPEEPVVFGRLKEHMSAETRHEELSLHPAPPRDFATLQGYLDPAPDGIDARFAWTLPGGRGQGITIVDVESGWNFQHEDLRRKQIGVVYGANRNSDHGTAVLGIYSGDQNGFGVTGISSNAIAGAASAFYERNRAKWNAARAIEIAADSRQAGDIILLEMHAPGPNASGFGQEGYVAIEYWRAEFAAIRYAVERGINVVEAAGNGGEDLDDPVYDHRFSRDHRDSGAILVGGGMSALQQDPRSRQAWSNYGSRLDVQGWGDSIVTTGGRQGTYYYDLVDHPEAGRCYTQSFGGTSGASPIVVGAMAAVNGCLKAAGRPVLSPDEMRRLLTETGTPQTDGPHGPSSQRIGPLPDLRAALARLGLA